MSTHSDGATTPGPSRNNPTTDDDWGNRGWMVDEETAVAIRHALADGYVDPVDYDD